LVLLQPPEVNKTPRRNNALGRIDLDHLANLAQHVLAQGKAKSNASFDCEDNLRVPADIIFGVTRGNCRDGCEEQMFGEEQQTPAPGPKRLRSGETRLGLPNGRARANSSASTECCELTKTTVLCSSRPAFRCPLNGALRRSQTDGCAISRSDRRDHLSRELPLRLVGRRRPQQT
jgi:hypothetical protein